MNPRMLGLCPSRSHPYRGDVWRVIGWRWPGDVHRSAMQDFWRTDHYHTFRDASPLLRWP